MISLYERLGGTEGITQIANDVVDLHLQNPRISTRFAGGDIPSLKKAAAAKDWVSKVLDQAESSLQNKRHSVNRFKQTGNAGAFSAPASLPGSLCPSKELQSTLGEPDIKCVQQS